jgi:hypothetical protein
VLQPNMAPETTINIEVWNEHIRRDCGLLTSRSRSPSACCRVSEASVLKGGAGLRGSCGGKQEEDSKKVEGDEATHASLRL